MQKIASSQNVKNNEGSSDQIVEKIDLSRSAVAPNNGNRDLYHPNEPRSLSKDGMNLIENAGNSLVNNFVVSQNVLFAKKGTY